MGIRCTAAVWAAKVTGFFCRLTGRQGVTLAGQVALKICPDLLRELSGQVKKKVFVTCGTNGKTTTNNMLCSALEAEGFKVIIAAAGLAAHLGGVLAANTALPVIGVPCKGGALAGVDALYATVQMPTGIPVATVAIDGGSNAAILACQMLALSDPELMQKIKDYKASLASSVEERDARLQQKIAEMN